jgi:hypothetical protein
VRWQARFQSLRHWIETHNGDLPTQKVKLPCGFSIGGWLRIQRVQLRRQRLEGVRICMLDDAAPGWRKTIALSSKSLCKRPNAIELELENRFTENLREAAALVAELGRSSRKNNMGINNDRLALWLSHLRWDESRGILPIERVQRLDHTLPGWRKEDILDEQERRWQNALVAYIARVKELGRLPTGLDPYARWMCRQRMAFKQDRLHEGRERALSDAVPGWKKFSRRRGSEQRTDERETTDVPAVSEQAGG